MFLSISIYSLEIIISTLTILRSNLHYLILSYHILSMIIKYLLLFLLQATAYFYSTILQIAQYMIKLKNVKINTSAQSNVSERNEIYNIAKWNLRSVLCEFNETLDKWEIIPPQVPEISTKCLRGRMDLTATQLIDIDFFSKLKKFSNQSFTVMQRLKKRQQNKKQKKAGRKKH